MKLSSITITGLINAARMIVLIPPALFFRHFYDSVWIITERHDQARDNGYCFFKYIRNKYPEKRVYYIIDKNAIDLQKLKSFGNIIYFNSLKHYFYYNLATVHISSHVGGCNPERNPFAKRLKRILGYKDVFIPHGVSYGIAEFCLAQYSKIDLFVTSGKPEYDNVLRNYGYNENQVIYTGFPRLDEWHHIHVNEKQIVLMPTWRMYLAQDPNTVFKNTVFYKTYYDLINNKELCDFLKCEGLRLYFYLHHEMRKYVGFFQSDCPNIVIIYRDADYDIQELLKESALLITDYSSVHFDFAYMGKPVLYYQFDKKEFIKRQYQKSFFDASVNGFGPVAYNQEQLIENLKGAYINGFQLSGVYEQRMKDFYQLRDENNCERVHDEIINHMNL